MDFSLRTFGDHNFEFSLKRMADRAAVPGPGLRPALDIIGKRMLRDERRLFESGGRTGGRPWRPLDKSTRLNKARAGYARPSAPLIATGEEMRSLSQRG